MLISSKGGSFRPRRVFAMPPQQWPPPSPRLPMRRDMRPSHRHRTCAPKSDISCTSPAIPQRTNPHRLDASRAPSSARKLDGPEIQCLNER
jgi:hypothetical protein